MKFFAQWTAIVLCCALLTGCAAAGKAEMDISLRGDSVSNSAPDSYYESEKYYDAIEEMPETESAIADSNYQAGKESASETASADNDLANRKLIKNANLTVETKAFDQFIVSLENQIQAFGGYVQSGESRGSADRGSRWSNYTVRIPADRYDGFLSQISTLGTVIYKSENVQDVTMAYTDTESHIRALETEYETLLSILEKCKELSDVITVQSRITDVNYQLDRYKSQLRQYDNLISYCTVYLNVSEVERVTIPVEEKTLGQRIVEDLQDNCKEILEDAGDFTVWFVSSLPYFAIWIVILGGIGALAFGLTKRSHRKLLERQAARDAAQNKEKDE